MSGVRLDVEPHEHAGEAHDLAGREPERRRLHTAVDQDRNRCRDVGVVLTDVQLDRPRAEPTTPDDQRVGVAPTERHRGRVEVDHRSLSRALDHGERSVTGRADRDGDQHPDEHRHETGDQQHLPVETVDLQRPGLESGAGHAVDHPADEPGDRPTGERVGTGFGRAQQADRQPHERCGERPDVGDEHGVLGVADVEGRPRHEVGDEDRHDSRDESDGGPDQEPARREWEVRQVQRRPGVDHAAEHPGDHPDEQTPVELGVGRNRLEEAGEQRAEQPGDRTARQPGQHGLPGHPGQAASVGHGCGGTRVRRRTADRCDLRHRGEGGRYGSGRCDHRGHVAGRTRRRRL